MKIPVFSAAELAELLEMKKVIAGVEAVYRLKAEGETAVWPLVAYEFDRYDAVMDIRSGCVLGDINVHGAKLLNNFPHNKEQGKQPFTGMLMVFDSTTGHPIGVMDASYITGMRTGAAGALGAKYLARKDAKTLMLLGAGRQAFFQIGATLLTVPTIEKVIMTDALFPENAEKFAATAADRLKNELGIDASGVTFCAASVEEAAKQADIIITVTPARDPVIKKEWVKPGTHFSCIGSDMEGKEEIDPALFVGAKVYADDLPQCIRVGEMERPIKEGYIAADYPKGEIGQLIAGEIVGRENDEEITIFDATGLALLDLVTAKAAITASEEKECGQMVTI